MNDDKVCPDCCRDKAYNVESVQWGYCPKWWAVKDPEAATDCKRLADRIAARVASTSSTAEGDFGKLLDAYRDAVKYTESLYDYREDATRAQKADAQTDEAIERDRLLAAYAADVERAGQEALGFAWAYACSLMDKGEDIRHHEVPRLLEAWNAARAVEGGE